MAIKIMIPTALRAYSGGNGAVDVTGGTVGEALEALTEQHSGLRKHLRTGDEKLRSFVDVYLNDEDIRYLDKEGTAISDGDTLTIVPSIAGGSPATSALRRPASPPTTRH